MTRYADPHRCPDCRAAITPGAPACRHCGLWLRGETAQRLFGTLAAADELLAALRAASAPTRAPTRAPSPAPFAPTPYPATRAGRLRRTAFGGRSLSVVSVPRILLTLGAGCLLVAALVFLAVTWSVLGVGGRTATLAGFTVVAGALAAWMARRGLRAATESLGLVGYGLLALDLVGAHHAGWFGALSGAGLLQLLGAALAVSGVAGAVAVRRTAVATLTAAEVVAGIGTALGVLGVGTSDGLPVAPSLVLATVLAAAATALGHRLRLRVARVATGAVTAVAWLSLTGYALDRTFAHDRGWHALWLGLEVWPLVVSAGLVAGAALLPRLPAAARVTALAVAHLLLVCAALAPTVRLQPTALTLVGLGVLVATGAAARLLPRPWGLVNALTQAFCAAGVLFVATFLAEQSAARLAHAARALWSGAAGDRLPAWAGPVDGPAAWLLPACVLVLSGTAWAVAGAGRAPARAVGVLLDLRLGASLLAGSVTATLALYPVPLWLVLAVLVAVAAGFTAWWLVGGSPVQVVVGAGFAAGAVCVSWHAAWLSAAVLVASVALAATVHLRGRGAGLAAAGGAALSVTLAGSVWSWGAAVQARPVWTALVGLLLLGALVLLAPYAHGRGSASAHVAVPRAGLEAGAAVAALVLALEGVHRSSGGQPAVWAALYLTVVGVAVTAMSLLRPDRRGLAWAGGALLAAASWVRLWDLGVSAPEAYTLPSAVVLVLVGLDRLRRDRSSRTLGTLGPGLSVALVPSLLWALDQPTGLRPLLLGIGCLLLVMAGARTGWTAPLALGAAVGALLVLRLAAPYVGDAVPRWVLIGGAGAVLIAVGATWERRLHEARSMLGYVRALR